MHLFSHEALHGSYWTMEKTRGLQGTMGGAPWLRPKVEGRLWKLRLEREVGTRWENGAGCKQSRSEEMETLMCLRGVEARRSDPITGTFLWGSHLIPFSQGDGKQHH